MIIYIILEILLFLAIILYKVFVGESWILNLFTFLPILLTSIVVSVGTVKNKKDIKSLYLAILLAVLGDLCFIYYNNIYGIYFFFLIQLCLMYYLNSRRLKVSYLCGLAILIFILCSILDNKYLIIEAILYFILFFFNLATMVKRLKLDKRLLLLISSFICLSICDFNVLAVFIIKKMNYSIILENICFSIEWLFYISFQIFISLYVVGASIRKNLLDK